jgi:2-C-methyl-D-erythritol 4-phosphate cytidylyltransferase
MANTKTPPIPRAAAVVVAAGSSTRMQLEPGAGKPFLELAGRTVLEHACAALVACGRVHELVIVAREEELSRVRELARRSDAFGKLRAVVPGGPLRTDSVRAGVGAVGEDCELVAIHDAARPLVRTELVERALECAAREGAALIAVPVTDTLKRCEQTGLATETVDRRGLWAAQTPQVFRRAEFLALLERASAESFTPTDDAALYEHFVGPLHLVLGDPTNFKLTTPADLELAEALLRARGPAGDSR